MIILTRLVLSRYIVNSPNTIIRDMSTVLISLLLFSTYVYLLLHKHRIHMNMFWIIIQLCFHFVDFRPPDKKKAKQIHHLWSCFSIFLLSIALGMLWWAILDAKNQGKKVNNILSSISQGRKFLSKLGQATAGLTMGLPHIVFLNACVSFSSSTKTNKNIKYS